MDNKQKNYILNLFDRIQRLRKSKKKFNKKGQDKISGELLDAENRLSFIMNSLSSEDRTEISSIMSERRHSRNHKSALKAKQSASLERQDQKEDTRPKQVIGDNLSNSIREQKFSSSNNDSEQINNDADDYIAKNKSDLPILTPINRKGYSQGIAKISEDAEEYVQSKYQKSKLDRANLSHHETQTILEGYLDFFSVHHMETKHIDVYANINGVAHIFEVKSITLRNEVRQTREAVGQLNEYAYLYNISEPRYYIVYSSKPQNEWLLGYLTERQGINVIWADNSQKYHLAGPGMKMLEQECLRDYKNHNDDSIVK
jgi:hypothetical protein